MKKKNYLSLIIISFLATCASYCFSQNGIHLLKQYNFSDGTYIVVGIICHNKEHEIQKKLGDFYINDIHVLNDIKNEWITGYKSPLYACGYHYNIYILKNGVKQKLFKVNLDEGCNTIVTDYGQYYFKSIYIKKLIGVAMSAKKEYKKFPSLKKARLFYKLLLDNKSLLFVPKPIWKRFDGSFRFWINLSNDFQLGQSLKKYINKVKIKIKNHFPYEIFSIKKSGISVGPKGKRIQIKIQGSKRLFNKFKLYDKDGGWNKYEPSLTIYWK